MDKGSDSREQYFMNDKVLTADKKQTGLISINSSYFLRGIAILMVIFSHYFEWGAEQSGNAQIAHFITLLGDWGVGIFFFMSGYALHLGYGSRHTDKGYLIKRFKNVYLPYLIIAAVIMLIAHELTDIKAFIRLMTGADYWFMVILFIIYIVFYLVGKLPEGYRVFIMTVFIIDLSLWFYLKEYREFWYTANWAFAFGMIVNKYENRISAVKNGFTIDIKDCVFCFLGKLSLYIYLLHAFIYFRVINMQAVIDSGMNWYIQLLIALIATVAVAFVSEKAIWLVTGGFRRSR